MRPIDLEPGEAILHEGDPGRCVVILPGVRYFSQAPLLWFAREVAQARGWSALELSERAPAEREPFDWMSERAEQAVDAAEQRAETVVVVGKSLASAAAPLVNERGLAAVWLTPLLVRPEVMEALSAVTAPTLAIGSKSDPTWGDGAKPSANALELLELGGLDHSLQLEGEPLRSLDVLREISARIGAFLDGLS